MKLSKVKEEIGEWSADAIVEALAAVQKARSRVAVREALEELQMQLIDQKTEVDEHLDEDRARVEALEAASESIDDLLTSVQDALANLDE